MQSTSSSKALPSWYKKHSRAYLFVFTLFMFAQAGSSQSPLVGSKNPTQAEVDSAMPQVKLRLSDTVSSASAKVGQHIQLEVVDPVEVDGEVIIAAGAHARATVTTAKRRGHNRSEGQLVLTVDSVIQVDGKEMPLRSKTLQKGSGHGLPIFGPCTFPIPADPVGLFKKGTDVVIPKGTELTATVALSNS